MRIVMKYIDADKLKAEIEKRRNNTGWLRPF